MKKVVHKIVRYDNSEYILREFKGELVVEDIMDSFVYILNENMIRPGCRGILTDLREADLNFNMNTFRNLIIYIKSSPGLDGLRIAVVVDSADKIVFPMMAANEPGLMIEPFSTMESAIKWINQ
jgi:hypothetical protein